MLTNVTMNATGKGFQYKATYVVPLENAGRNCFVYTEKIPPGYTTDI